MKLYRVTIFAKKDYMKKFLELQWAVISDKPENAIKQILDEFDLSGIEIKEMKATEEKYIIIK